MKRMFVATGIVLAMVFMVFTASAKADVTFVGLGPNGADPSGNTWVWNTTIGAPYFPGVAGNSAWVSQASALGNWSGPARRRRISTS